MSRSTKYIIGWFQSSQKRVTITRIDGSTKSVSLSQDPCSEGATIVVKHAAYFKQWRITMLFSSQKNSAGLHCWSFPLLGMSLSDLYSLMHLFIYQSITFPITIVFGRQVCLENSCSIQSTYNGYTEGDVSQEQLGRRRLKKKMCALWMDFKQERDDINSIKWKSNMIQRHIGWIYIISVALPEILII